MTQSVPNEVDIEPILVALVQQPIGEAVAQDVGMDVLGIAPSKVTVLVLVGDQVKSDVDRSPVVEEDPDRKRSGETPSEASDVPDSSVETDAQHGSAKAGVEAFAHLEILQAPETVVPFRPVYERYEEFAATHRFNILSDRKFTAALQEYFTAGDDDENGDDSESNEGGDDPPVVSKPQWNPHAGETQSCLIGIDLPESDVPSWQVTTDSE